MTQSAGNAQLAMASNFKITFFQAKLNAEKLQKERAFAQTTIAEVRPRRIGAGPWAKYRRLRVSVA